MRRYIGLLIVALLASTALAQSSYGTHRATYADERFHDALWSVLRVMDGDCLIAPSVEIEVKWCGFLAPLWPYDQGVITRLAEGHNLYQTVEWLVDVQAGVEFHHAAFTNFDGSRSYLIRYVIFDQDFAFFNLEVVGF